MHLYGTVKPIEVILRWEWGRKNHERGLNKLGHNVCIYGNLTMKSHL
jgi:hypothetical protein